MTFHSLSVELLDKCRNERTYEWLNKSKNEIDD